MRRFYGYLALIVSLILVVFCNIQTQIQGIKSGIEYSGGYEILYKVDFRESKKSIEDISNIVVSRLEDAKVPSANVQAEKGDGAEYIRIQMSGSNTTEIDYALRSVESTGKLTVSTLMDGANFSELENPFVVNSATVNWNQSNPYVQVEVKDVKNFISFVDNCKSDYEAFNAEYNKDSEKSSNVEGVMVIWLDKEDDDSYLSAYQNENEVSRTQTRSRVLAIVPTNNFTYDTDANGEYTNAKLLISYYDFEQTQMVAQSAHTVERIINYGSEDYSMKRLYTQRIDSTVTNISSYDQLIMVGFVVSLCLLLVYLVLRFGLAGLTGWVAISLSMFAQIAFFNYFEYAFSTIAAIAFIASFVINVAAVIVYLEKFKNELYKGKTALKASQEASKGTLVTIIDYTIVGLLISVVGILAFSSQINLLPIVICMGTLSSLVLARITLLFAMWWLTNNKLAAKPAIFACKTKDIPDVMKMETQTKFPPLSNLDVKKNGKKSIIGVGVASVICALLISIFAIIPGVNVFNDSRESKEYSRIEIASEIVGNEYLWQYGEESKKFFEEKYPELKVTGIDSNIVDNVVSETASENLVTVDYISVSLDGVIGEDYYDKLVRDISNENGVDREKLTVNIVTCKAKSVNYLFNSSIIATVIVTALAVAFVLIRYGYNYAISSTVTLIPTILVALAFYSATRLPISALSLVGIAAGSFIVLISQIPFYERIKRLIHESKVKVTTYDQKEEIAIKAFKETIFTSLIILAVGLATTIVVALFSPLTSSVTSTYGSMAITIVVGALATLFILAPVYLFLEKHVRFSIINRRNIRKEKNKKAMKKAREANKNSGAEPEESKIPGINC